MGTEDIINAGVRIIGRIVVFVLGQWFQLASRILDILPFIT